MTETIKLRDYQIEVDEAQRAFMHSEDKFRALVFMCTGSGKTENYLKLIAAEAEKRGKRNRAKHAADEVYHPDNRRKWHCDDPNWPTNA